MRSFESGNKGVFDPRRGLLILSLLFASNASDSVPYYSPERDESFEAYDFTILDPTSALGSPLGGFSRATRSRLAALPLYLPDITLDATDEKEVEKEPEYMEVTDSYGNKYVCRVYQENELEPSSLKESMFHPPKLRLKVQESEPNSEDGEEDDEEVQGVTASVLSEPPQRVAAESVDESFDTATYEAVIDADGRTLIGTEEMNSLIEEENDNAVISAYAKISELEGVCGQLHKGWWSYEWCFEKTVSQFHVQIDKRGAQVRVEDVSVLGRYHSRTVLRVTSELQRTNRNKFLFEQHERTRVVDEYTNGALCDETGKPRRAFVHLQCCAPSVMEKTKGLLHKHGKRIDNGIASVASIVENPTCSYNVTVCTPLLCEDELPTASMTLDLAHRATGRDMADSGGQEQSSLPKKKQSHHITSKSTIREILDSAMDGHCLLSDTGGWWVYEFCHRGRIRQYHEAVGTKRTLSGATIMSKTLETEHVLGRYNTITSDAFPGEDWRFVVNATKGTKTGTVGNGAYFELEYTNGDVCDHSDVTDAAIIAGSAGAGGIARASSVRYSCGNEYTVNVNEDATCHYVVQVTLPELCQHPLFMAPVTKKQVVKCLPAKV